MLAGVDTDRSGTKLVLKRSGCSGCCRTKQVPLAPQRTNCLVEISRSAPSPGNANVPLNLLDLLALEASVFGPGGSGLADLLGSESATRHLLVAAYDPVCVLAGFGFPLGPLTFGQAHLERLCTELRTNDVLTGNLWIGGAHG